MRYVFAAVMALCCSTAIAATDDAKAPDSYLMVGGGYMVTGDDRNADFGAGFLGGYATRLALRTYLEFNVFTQVLETGVPGPDFYRLGGGLDLLQGVGPQNDGHLIFLLGVGGAMTDVVPNEDDGGSFYVNGGLGWRFAASEKWGLRPRVEVRSIMDTFDDGKDDLMFNLIFEIPPKREVERIVEVERVVEKPVERIVEREVIREVQVEVAPTDSDNDGIVDARDKCPNTLAGAKVGPDGCVIQEQVVTLPNIEFESGKGALTSKGEGTLEAVLRFLQSQPNVGLDVYGHTDAQGSDAYNQKLSDSRAQSVMDYLVGKGIPKTRLTARGFGESKPIATNETKEGRAQNRRVELRIRTTAQ